MIRAEISSLELEPWTPEVGRDINDPAADNYRIVQVNDALSLVMCSTVPYSGWLAKQVSPLVFPAKRIHFHYDMMIDDATAACAQVAETDAKITDAEGWTYDLSAQWEMQKSAPGWMFQIDSNDWKWIDTGIVIPALEPYEPQRFVIDYALNYQEKQSAITAVHVGHDVYEVPESLLWISARQEGWAPSEVVSQLQEVNNHDPGGYTLRFTNIGYIME